MLDEAAERELGLPPPRRRLLEEHQPLGAHERAGQQLLHGVVPTQEQVAQVVTVQLVPAAIGQEQRALLRLVVPASWGIGHMSCTGLVWPASADCPRRAEASEA